MRSKSIWNFEALDTSHLHEMGDHVVTMNMFGSASQTVRRIRTKGSGSRDHIPALELAPRCFERVERRSVGGENLLPLRRDIEEIRKRHRFGKVRADEKLLRLLHLLALRLLRRARVGGEVESEYRGELRALRRNCCDDSIGLRDNGGGGGSEQCSRGRCDVESKM